MEMTGIHGKLLAHFGPEVILGLTAAEGGVRDPFITVAGKRIDRVCLLLRGEPDLAFDFIQSITAIDTGESFTCVYHLYSYRHRHTLVLKAETGRPDPRLPTCTSVWPAADWYEREVYDLFGIRFDGHPDLRRLLLPEDWEGHPMRKDYKEQPFYRTEGTRDSPIAMVIPTTRENPLDLLDDEGERGGAGA